MKKVILLSAIIFTAIVKSMEQNFFLDSLSSSQEVNKADSLLGTEFPLVEQDWQRETSQYIFNIEDLENPVYYQECSSSEIINKTGDSANISDNKLRNTVKKKYRYNERQKTTKCPFCPKRYSSKRGFETHIKKHEGNLPYKCDFPGCQSAFVYRSGLIAHKLVHSKNLLAKRYLCPFSNCRSRFNTEDDLTVHLNIHKKGKPFKCPISGCGESLCNKDSLRVHISNHNKPLQKCPYCRYSTINSCNLKRHILKKHNQA